MYAAYPVQAIRLDFSTASMTTAWATLSSSLSNHTKVAEIYNSSAIFLELGIGSGAAPIQTIAMTVFASGGNGRIDLAMDKGAKLWARGVTATASTGVLAINLFG